MEGYGLPHPPRSEKWRWLVGPSGQAGALGGTDKRRGSPDKGYFILPVFLTVFFPPVAFGVWRWQAIRSG